MDKSPKLLNLKQLIEIYIKHQEDVLTRKTKYEADKVKVRIHILEGLLIALEDIDSIIALIKKSESAAAAKVALMSQYNLSEAQAKAILDMKLSKLAHIESVEVQTEKNQLVEELERLSNILANPTPELVKIFNELKKTYGDSRLTTITQVSEKKEDKEIEFVEPEKCVVVMTEGGTIKRIPSTSFRAQRRNGKGVRTQEDITSAVIRTNTIDSLMIFSDKGKMYRLLVNDIPVGTNVSKGQSIKSLINMEIDEQPAIMYSIYRDTDAKYVLFTTKNGLVKKTSLEEYISTKKKTGIGAINLREGDSLASVSLIKDEPIVLITANGYMLKCNSTDVSATSRMTTGVKGINLGADDYVVAALPVRDTNDALAVFSEHGFGKKLAPTEMMTQKRGGKGIICFKGTDKLAAATLVSDGDMVLICGDRSSICIDAVEIPILGRATTGNQMLKDNKILSVSKV